MAPTTAAGLDALRHTLDELQLDPTSPEDIPYLTSILRRLGYTEQQIRQLIREETEVERETEIEYLTNVAEEAPQPRASYEVVRPIPHVREKGPTALDDDFQDEPGEFEDRREVVEEDGDWIFVDDEEEVIFDAVDDEPEVRFRPIQPVDEPFYALDDEPEALEEDAFDALEPSSRGVQIEVIEAPSPRQARQFAREHGYELLDAAPQDEEAEEDPRTWPDEKAAKGGRKAARKARSKTVRANSPEEARRLAESRGYVPIGTHGDRVAVYDPHAEDDRAAGTTTTVTARGVRMEVIEASSPEEARRIAQERGYRVVGTSVVRVGANRATRTRLEAEAEAVDGFEVVPDEPKVTPANTAWSSNEDVGVIKDDSWEDEEAWEEVAAEPEKPSLSKRMQAQQWEAVDDEDDTWDYEEVDRK